MGGWPAAFQREAKSRTEAREPRSRGVKRTFCWESLVLMVEAAAKGSVREARTMREVGWERARERAAW